MTRSYAAYYYVNDTSTNGDVYCSAVGADGGAGRGTNAATPALTLGGLLSVQTISPGDTVFIDTGVYSNHSVTLTSADAGAGGTDVIFQGSTNLAAGGTVIQPQNTSLNAFWLNGVTNVVFRQLSVRSAQYAFAIDYGQQCRFESLVLASNSAAFWGRGSNIFMRNCLAVGNSRAMWMFNQAGSWFWDNGVFWNNTSISKIEFSNYQISISNSVLVGGSLYEPFGSGGYTPPPRGDYNVIWNIGLGGLFSSLHDLTRATPGAWAFSTWSDPLFVNGPSGDFHEQSIVGSYTNGSFATYSNHSPLIDFAPSTAPFSLETQPNGSNRNAGLYGNTPEAGRSRTNAWIFATAFNDGGEATGLITLAWAAGNFTNGSTLKVDYSLDRGVTWVQCTSSVPVTNRSVTWNVSSVTSSPVALWRVGGESPAYLSVCDTNNLVFTVRGIGSNTFYVNDSNTSGDVYCSAPGSAANSGLSASQPAASIQQVLDAYDLGPGDIVYVDTGRYTGQTTTISLQDKGSATDLLRIQGSTNASLGGTVLDRQSTTEDVMVFANSGSVNLRNLTMQRGRYGLYLQGAASRVEFVTVISNQFGFYGFGTNHLLRRCQALFNAVNAQSCGAYCTQGATPWSWDQCLFFGNTFAVRHGTAADRGSFSNCVFVGGTFYEPSVSPPAGDHGLFWNVSFGALGTLNGLQKQVNAWWRSTVDDPQFVGGLDFHERSLTGTYTNGLFVPYATHSASIDFGNPAAPVGDETPPNGGRINAGPYGGTVEAGRSRTNEWLQALTYRDGGTLSVPSDTVYWNYGNLSSGATLRIEFSSDDGATWSPVKTGLLASAGSYTWSDTNFASSRFARWRVVLEANTNVVAGTPANFVFRNGAFVYYLNDGTTNGDLYCTATGSDANLGTSPATPKYSLQSLLNAHTLLPGDIIYADTGIYNIISNQSFSSLDSGGTNGFVSLIGSTNLAAGGTVFNRGSSAANAYALELNGASYISLADIVLRGAGVGLRMNSASSVRVTRIRIEDAAVDGVQCVGSSGIDLDQAVVRRNASRGLYVNGGQVAVRRSIFHRNANAAIRVDAGTASVTGCVIHAAGGAAYGYYAVSSANIVGGYNAFHTESNAVVGYLSSMGRNADALGSWIALTGQERMSLEGDPLFADAQNGDFHLKTQTFMGRPLPFGGGYTNDPVTSPLIDAGPPASSYGAEPVPNGARVDIGYFGNTAEASTGRTNAWVYAASLRQGGFISGTGHVHWIAGPAAATGTVAIDISVDGGGSWSNLAASVSATQESFGWNAGSLGDTPAGLWRIRHNLVTGLVDAVTNFFAVRNAALNIHVNDGSTTGDVYTSAAGRSTNYAATSSQPIDSLATAVRLFDLEPGDRVWVDSGLYTNQGTVLLGRYDGGMSSGAVQFAGSTGQSATATIIDHGNTSSGQYGMQAVGIQYVSLSNLVFRSANVGMKISSSAFLQLGRIRTLGNSGSGVEADGADSLVFRRFVSARNGSRGFDLGASTSVVVEQSILYSNVLGAIRVTGGQAAVSNSVLHAHLAGGFVYDLQGNPLLRADYNDVLNDSVAPVGRIGAGVYPDLRLWQEASSQDVRSLSHDPRFADASGGDFHPRSQAGRVSSNGTLVYDSDDSPLIDTGGVGSPYGNEPLPNGARVDVGLYGNDAEASRSRTNAWLLAVSLNSGGSTRATNTLYWVAGGAATGHLVNLQYSADAGLSWTNITTNIPASAGSYVWNSSSFGSSAVSRWRIQSTIDSNIMDATDSTFILNNGPLTYYVNDGATSGDVYTSSPGDSSNTGASPGSPKSSLQEIVDSYRLVPGDQVLIDTGSYNLPESWSIGEFDTGSVTNPVAIRGSTNAAAGGTRLNRMGGSYAMRIEKNTGIVLQHLRISNASPALLFNQATNCAVQFVDIVGGSYGIELNTAPFFSARQSLVRDCDRGIYVRSSANLLVEHSVLWSNETALYASASSVTVSNSVIGAIASNQTAYVLDPSATLVADFNDIFLENGGKAATRLISPKSITYETLSRWARDYAQDRRSLSHDPRFADPDAGDYHPRSVAFRFTRFGTVTNDLETSPLIDAGAPTAAYSNEPSANGRRVNIGLYGNTSEASGSPTNAYLRTVSLNDGGRVEGAFSLVWTAVGAATGHTVRVDYSADDGSSWIVIATGLQASVSSLIWDTSAFPGTLHGRWRVSSLIEPAVSATSRIPFAVRNSPFQFYVNDAAGGGDAFCSAPGSPTNTGLLASQPLDSIQGVFDRYDLEGGDIVWVDTGLYALTNPIVCGEFDGGNNLAPVSIRGSTNQTSGGTIFVGAGFELRSTDYVVARDLSVHGGTTGFRFADSIQCGAARVAVVGGLTGFDVDSSSGVVMSNCVARNASDHGLYVRNNSTAVSWHNGVLWSNRYAIRQEGGSVSLRNTAMGAFHATGAAIYLGSGNLDSDYNSFFLRQGAPAGFMPGSNLGTYFESLSRWTRDLGKDAHSLSTDPLFANAPGGDFHPLSRAGRWIPGVGYTNDMTTSPLIDAGDPSMPYAAEPGPNGRRSDIGCYASDAEASLSGTNASLLALSLNDGGRAEGTVTLHWVAQGAATGHTVRVDFSADDGVTWTTVATGLNAAAGGHAWTTTSSVSTALARWRVASETEPAVLDETDRFFALRNAPLSFYVNDGSVTGDVYTVAPGRTTNTGTGVASPMTSLQDVLSAYDLEPGDQVYVDTGVYLWGTEVAIGRFDCGAGGTKVSFVGSTNEAAGGSLIDRQGGSYAFSALQAPDIELRNLRIRNASVAGVRFYQSDGAWLRDVAIRGCAAGADVNDSDGLLLRQSVIQDCAGVGVRLVTSDGALLENSVLWSNANAVYFNNASAVVSNCALGVFGPGRYAYYFAAGSWGGIVSDYNDLYRTNGADLAYIAGSPAAIVQTLSRWARDSGQDRHSLSHDPAFAAPGSGDFHLQSPAGRFLPGGGYTNDARFSVLIDAGAPAASYGAEPVPNGGRLDIGRYGNHPESSLSPTNPSLTAVSLNDGGRVDGTYALYWVARGFATGESVRIDFSPDGGVGWINITTGVSARAETCVWGTTGFPNTVLGRWRVMSESDPNVHDVSDALFAVRNGPLEFYVNDGSLAGDVFASVAGSATNLGVSPFTPKASIQDVLDSYDLEPGDRIFVDTGTYILNAPITLGVFDAGTPASPVVIQGSTNLAAGGTILNRFGGDRCLVIDGASGVGLRHMTMRNASLAAVRWINADDGFMEWIRTENNGTGVEVDQSDRVVSRHCVARGNVLRGVVVRSGSLSWNQGVVWSNGVGCQIENGSVSVSNTIFGVFQANASAYLLQTGTLDADYNGYFLTNDAALARVAGAAVGGGTSRYMSVGAWNSSTARDTHSLPADPLFAAAAAGDLHLRSQAGRYVPGSGFVTDMESSPFIDAGDPSASAAIEPEPNGGRLNIGVHGNSSEASKTPTNASLTTLSLSDGGTASGLVILHWLATGAATSHIVRIAISSDGGATFSTVASGVPASAGSYAWDSSGVTSSPLAVWRITSEVETNVFGQSPRPFSIRNGAGITFYVNDGSASGDMYCTAVGAGTNMGFTPSSPLHSIQAVLDAYDLEPGDRILVDTGTYALPADIRIGDLDSGSASSPVVIQGSTASAAGGTVLNRQVAATNASVIDLYQAAHVDLKHLRLINAGKGVSMGGSVSCGLSDLRIEGMLGPGIIVSNCASISISNCLVWGCAAGIVADSTDAALRNSIVWSSGTALELLHQAVSSVRNCILQADGAMARVYKLAYGTSLIGDYNNLVRTNGAYLAEQVLDIGGSDVFQTLTSWTVVKTQEVHSLSHHPGFANPTGGDFHLLSTRGRYVPGAGYVTDSVHSVLIDAGEPGAPFANEPVPNGERLDLGIYGNRGDASLSRTSAWLVAVSFNDGGTLGLTNRLIWNAGIMPTGALAHIEYSLNQGITWATVASNVLALSGNYIWDVSVLPPTVRGLWRISLQSDTGVTDSVDSPFIIRTAALQYYVNDSDTNGDVYCTAPGHPSNSGNSPATPLPTIQHVLDAYPLSPGDTIRVDTGIYPMTNPLLLNELVRGETGFPVKIEGSTNRAGGGSLLYLLPVASSSAVISMSQTRYINLSNIGISGGATGLYIQNSRDCNLSALEVFQNRGPGIQIAGAGPVIVDRCLVRDNRGYGMDVLPGSSVRWSGGVVWSNTAGPVRIASASLFLRNSVLEASSATNFVFMIGSSADITSDYNLFWRQNGAGVARNTLLMLSFANMAEWQGATGQDAHTLLGDPLFADPANADFHERSAGGRYANGVFVADTDTSPLVDAGDPAHSFTGESLPNGSRLNIGLYGGTVEASRSPPSPKLRNISLSDGGTVRGATPLYWLPQGFSATSTVSVQYSSDAGSTWSNIATSVSAATGGYMWDPSGYISSPAGRWRVVADADTNVWAAISTNFFLRVGSINFYVNDATLAGDVYCTGPGTSTNLGLAASYPMASLSQVLEAYDLDGGDIVYVDTGNYTTAVDTIIGSLDSGLATSPVKIVGSTNWMLGGTVLHKVAGGDSNSTVISLSAARYVDMSNLNLQRAGTCLHLFQTTGAHVRGFCLRDGTTGLRIDESSGNRFEQIAITRMSGAGISARLSSANGFSHMVIWSNGGHAVSIADGSIAISNSVLHARGAGRLCYSATNASISSDYNDLFPEVGAYYGSDAAGLVMESLPQWTAARGVDFHSLSVDPLFAGAAADDFHVRSVAGRFDPATGGFSIDTNHSYLIDTGDPYTSAVGEPDPNGSRVNIGLHGGGSEASRSRTNAWLLALTASSGGRLSGSIYLDWAWGGMSASNTLRLEYSYDDGVSWTGIAAGVSVASADHAWDSVLQQGNGDVFISSPIARWRAVLESNTNLFDVTDGYFALRNSPFIYYVNDTSTVGDVYTTATGSDTNLGLFPYAPKATLESLLGSLDVEGSDVIEIDTGVYNVTNSFGNVTAVDSGREGLDVVIRGSTNGTRINRLSGPATVFTVSGPNVRLRDVSISGGSLALSGGNIDLTAVAVTNGGITVTSAGVTLTNVVLAGSPLTASGASNLVVKESMLRNGGITLTDSRNALLQNLAIHGSAAAGINIQGSSIPVAIRHCTVVASGNAFQMGGSATVFLENNILVADGPGRFCLLPEGGVLASSDYNNLVARNGAWIGSRNGFWERLSYWQRESGQDSHSISLEPLFANEAAGDFHLKSTAGRYSGGVFVADAVHSPSIDAADPLAGFGLESAPNGLRANQGAYGGTAEASRSRTNAWLLVVTGNDGGVLRGTNLLRWSAGNVSSNDTVTLQFSTNSGAGWIAIAAGVPVTNGAYAWNSTLISNSLAVVWRLTLDPGSSIADTSDAPFVVRNAPLSFYVNNSQTQNDVFATAPGSSGNSGLSPGAPKDSIAGILNAYDTEGGDTIYVDTGVYLPTGDTAVIWSRGGSAATGPLVIRGSTNMSAGGTVLVRGATNNGIGVDIRASHVTLRDLAVRDASRGIAVQSNRQVRIERVLAYSNEVGIVITQAVNATLVNSRLWNNRQGGVDVQGSATTTVEHCTFVGNAPHSARFLGSLASVLQNDIFYMSGTNAPAALAGSASDIFIDYNIYFFETGGAILGTNTSLLDWQLNFGHDYRSSITNPMLANAAGGDFHERSAGGRYVDGTGYVADTVTSWAVDRANPASSYANEPAVNGGRANIGAYGNTEFAGKGSTNVSVELRILNDPTIISETNSLWPLVWTARNVATNEPFRIQFSGDGGTNWVDLQTGIMPYGEVFLWQTTPYYNTYKGRWRVVSQNNTNLVDVNDSAFQIFYGQFAISSQQVTTGGLNQVVWRGAWGENYRVQYSTNALVWLNGPNGPATNQVAVFFSTNGGDFIYQDIGSATNRHRLYRIVRDQF